MSDLTRQQLCAALQISESTVRRLELDGLPCTPVGRSKRYDLAEVKTWLRANHGRPPSANTIRAAPSTAALAFIESSMKVKRRVQPSGR